MESAKAQRSRKVHESARSEEVLLSLEEFGIRLGGIKASTLASWLSLGKFGLVRVKVGSRTMLAESDLEKVIRRGEKSCGPKQVR